MIIIDEFAIIISNCSRNW